MTAIAIAHGVRLAAQFECLACDRSSDELTGSLLGPIAAHALVNGLNLQFLKSHEPAARAPGQSLEAV